MKFFRLFLAVVVILGAFGATDYGPRIARVSASDSPSCAAANDDCAAAAVLGFTTGGVMQLNACLGNPAAINRACTILNTSCDCWNVPQGTTTTLRWRNNDEGINPPNLPTGDHAGDLCELRLFWDNGAVITRILHSATTCPAVGTLYEISPTSNGLPAGTPTAGTVRLQIHIVDNTPVGANLYDVSSDVDTGNGIAEQRGALRYGMDVSAINHGGYPAGTTHAYKVAGESITFNLVHTAANAQQTTRNIVLNTVRSGATCGTNTNIETATVAFETDGTTTRSYTVSDTYPAAAEIIGLELTDIGNSGLTAQDWTFIQGTFSCGGTTTALHGTALKADFVSVDPRVTATHLIQFDDSVYGTPPLSKDACCTRLTSQLGFLSTRWTNAREEGLGQVANTFQFTLTLTDAAALGSPESCAGLGIGTHGGQTGWQEAPGNDFCVWDNILPGGVWTKTIDITAPASIDADSHVLNGTKAYFLAAVNPDVASTITYHTTGTDLHLSYMAGSISSPEMIPFDTNPPPKILFTREINHPHIEYLANNLSWQPAITSFDEHILTEVPGRLYWNLSVPLALFQTADFQITASGFVGGAPTFEMAHFTDIPARLATNAVQVDMTPTINAIAPILVFVIFVFWAERSRNVWVYITAISAGAIATALVWDELNSLRVFILLSIMIVGIRGWREFARGGDTDGR